MNYTLVGWMFLAIAALFASSLHPVFASKIYPNPTKFSARLAAPAIFAALGVACMTGWAVPALALTTVVGIGLIALSRWQSKRALFLNSLE